MCIHPGFLSDPHKDGDFFFVLCSFSDWRSSICQVKVFICSEFVCQGLFFFVWETHVRFPSGFSVSVSMIIYFIKNLLIWWIKLIFFKHYQSYILEVNPTASWWSVLHFVVFKGILLGIFTCMFMKNAIGLQFSFLKTCFPGIVIRLILVLWSG